MIELLMKEVFYVFMCMGLIGLIMTLLSFMVSEHLTNLGYVNVDEVVDLGFSVPCLQLTCTMAAIGTIIRIVMLFF